MLLPVMDGTTCSTTRTDDPVTATIPIVAISAGMTLKKQIGEPTQADALLPTPFAMDDLSLLAEHRVRKGAR